MPEKDPRMESQQSEQSERKRTELQSRREGRHPGLARPEPYGGPFSFVRRFSEEMDRLFEDFGLGGSLFPRGGRQESWLAPRFGREFGQSLWLPDVEVFQRGNELVVRADLPGLNKDQVKVDITDDELTIQGERKSENEEDREGFYRSERSYGTFYRSIPLPEGVITESAKATFRDGVLEITMPAPPQEVSRGRRLQISEATEPKTGS